ncbi:hypothetical protein CMI37_22040 [Candidatus Pacearchaeota archaeon]|nr:hypothetical protein [Candidatus Pacearchaeota archaeon]
MPKEQKKQGKNDQYLIDYLRKLQRLNDIEVDIPQTNIDEVIKNPRQYALDFIELEFAKTVPKFIQSYKEGFAFGKKNK